MQRSVEAFFIVVYIFNFFVRARVLSELHQAIQMYGNETKIYQLLNQGQPLEMTDHCGWTPLGEAVNESNLSYLRILMSYGAKLDHRNDDGVTALISASVKGWLDASVTIKDNSGNMGLSYLRGHQRDKKRGVSEDYTPWGDAEAGRTCKHYGGGFQKAWGQDGRQGKRYIRRGG